MSKRGLIVYHDYREKLEDLSNEQIGELFRAMLDYDIDGVEPIFDNELKIAWKFIRINLYENKEKYNNICQRNQQNIQKRWNTKDTTGKTGIPNDTKNTDTDTDTDTNKDIYINILCYLNEKAETKFKNIESNLKFIRARMQSGYTESDLKSVIDSKVKEWKGTDMQKYLRPETLFNATKFESYVNGLKGNIGNHNYNQKEYTKEELDAIVDNLDDVLDYVKEV